MSVSIAENNVTPEGGRTRDDRDAVFDAPRALVFWMWTDSSQLWGPHSFTNPVCEVDARPGRAIRIDMRGPDDVVYPNKGTFHVVDENYKTRLTLQARVVKSAGEADAFLAGMKEGWSQ